MPSPLDQPETAEPAQTVQTITDDAGTSIPAQPLAIENNLSESAPRAETEEIHTLDVGDGNIVKLDKLGPMIVNSDGTLSRIQNWQDLHPIEQERTVRLLVKKRNLVRLQKLDDQDSGRGEKLSGLKQG